MSKPQIFNHQAFGELPVIVSDGVEWFGATEAAKALSFSKPHDAIANHVDEDDSAVYGVTDSLGRTQQKKFINESGLYSLVFGAAKQGNNPDIQAKAKEFKRWVTSEVLPTIRKHGAYTLPTMSPAEILAGVANQLVEQERRVKALEARIAETSETIETIQDTLLQRDEDWRKSINSMLNGASYRLGGNYRDLRNKSYVMLEDRGRCDLDKRLRNLVERLEASGATKTQLRNTSRMDVIEADPRLKEIYTSIVKELSIGSLRAVK